MTCWRCYCLSLNVHVLRLKPLLTVQVLMNIAQRNAGSVECAWGWELKWTPPRPLLCTLKASRRQRKPAYGLAVWACSLRRATTSPANMIYRPRAARWPVMVVRDGWSALAGRRAPRWRPLVRVWHPSDSRFIRLETNTSSRGWSDTSATEIHRSTYRLSLCPSEFTATDTCHWTNNCDSRARIFTTPIFVNSLCLTCLRTKMNS